MTALSQPIRVPYHLLCSVDGAVTIEIRILRVGLRRRRRRGRIVPKRRPRHVCWCCSRCWYCSRPIEICMVRVMNGKSPPRGRGIRQTRTCRVGRCCSCCRLYSRPSSHWLTLNTSDWALLQSLHSCFFRRREERISVRRCQSGVPLLCNTLVAPSSEF